MDTNTNTNTNTNMNTNTNTNTNKITNTNIFEYLEDHHRVGQFGPALMMIQIHICC